MERVYRSMEMTSDFFPFQPVYLFFSKKMFLYVKWSVWKGILLILEFPKIFFQNWKSLKLAFYEHFHFPQATQLLFLFPNKKVCFFVCLYFCCCCCFSFKKKNLCMPSQYGMYHLLSFCLLAKSTAAIVTVLKMKFEITCTLSWILWFSFHSLSVVTFSWICQNRVLFKVSNKWYGLLFLKIE